MNKLFNLSLLLMVLFANLSLNAQRTAKVNGKYTYILTENDNVTIKDAKIKSIEMAQAEAIRSEFGTMVLSDFINSERAQNNDLSSYYIMDTSTSVKGEWLGDEKEPEVNIEVVDGKLFFTAEVWGTAREIIRANTELIWEVQRDDDGKKVGTDNFNTGERFFVKFRSPTDGYVAIYLITADNETACLLPYKKDGSGRCFIKGGKDYTFFDRTTDPNASYYKLSTNELLEHNQLVVVYSPNSFTKCTDTSGDPKRPNYLSQKDFAKWLLKNQRADKDMVVNRKWITIQGTE